MYLKKNLLYLLLIGLLIGCGKTDDNINLEDTIIPYSLIEQGNFTVPEDDTINEQYLVFDNEDKWDFFLKKVERINPEQERYFKGLGFDFSTKTLIIVTTEYSFYCCKEIEIVKVYRNHGRIYVDFEIGEPASEEKINQSYVLLEVAKN